MSAKRNGQPSQTLLTQDLVLTIVGAYLGRDGETVWSGGMVEMLGEFGSTVEGARAALARLASRGLIQRHKSGRLVSYSLSTRGTELMLEGDRRIFTFGRSEDDSDQWTMLWHAIPDERRVERSRLASRLRFLGFGPAQDATWVAAHDREVEALALLEELGISDFASILVGRHSIGLVPDTLVSQAWDLESVTTGYEEFLSQFGPYRRSKRRSELSDKEAFVIRTMLLHRFRAYPSVDPELPKSICPLHEIRTEVVNTFDEVFAELAEPANRYFRSIAKSDLALNA